MNDNAPAGIGGIIVPMVTPLDESEGLDVDAIRRHARRCLNEGADGLFLGGSAGMGPMLTARQWETLLREVLEVSSPRETLLVGIMETSTPRALERIRLARRLGYERFVITPSYYITLERDAEFDEHFRRCVDEAGQPALLYNIPGCTYSRIPLGVVEQMISDGLVSGIKESSGDRHYFSKLLEIGSRSGVPVLQGNEPDILWALGLGASGAVPVCANVAPRLFRSLFDQSSNGVSAEKLQSAADDLRDGILLGSHSWIAGAMEAMRLLGFGSGRVLPPLQRVTDQQQRDRIRAAVLAAEEFVPQHVSE